MKLSDVLKSIGIAGVGVGVAALTIHFLSATISTDIRKAQEWLSDKTILLGQPSIVQQSYSDVQLNTGIQATTLRPVLEDSSLSAAEKAMIIQMIGSDPLFSTTFTQQQIDTVYAANEATLKAGADQALAEMGYDPNGNSLTGGESYAMYLATNNPNMQQTTEPTTVTLTDPSSTDPSSKNDISVEPPVSTGGRNYLITNQKSGNVL